MVKEGRPLLSYLTTPGKTVGSAYTKQYARTVTAEDQTQPTFDSREHPVTGGFQVPASLGQQAHKSSCYELQQKLLFSSLGLQPPGDTPESSRTEHALGNKEHSLGW